MMMMEKTICGLELNNTWEARSPDKKGGSLKVIELLGFGVAIATKLELLL